MKQVIKLKKLVDAPYFVSVTLRSLFPELSQNSLQKNIDRWLREGVLVQIKKGMYTTKEFISNLSEENKGYYKEYIANVIKPGSYISCEYVLQKHEMISESVFAVTSTTLKKTARYKNLLGLYTYKNIKSELFMGYQIHDRGFFMVKEASKMKALFDFLYSRLYRFPSFTPELLDSFRLNIDSLSPDQMREFKSYCKLSCIKKFEYLPNLLHETYAN